MEYSLSLQYVLKYNSTKHAPVIQVQTQQDNFLALFVVVVPLERSLLSNQSIRFLITSHQRNQSDPLSRIHLLQFSASGQQGAAEAH